MQNLARFRTISYFDGKYVRNGWRYPESKKRLFSCWFFPRSWDVSLDPPKSTISENRISTLKWCMLSGTSTPLENDQLLLAHSFFYNKHPEIGLKFNVTKIQQITLEPNTNIFHRTCREAGVISGYSF